MAMPSHRRGCSTHREAGMWDPQGGFPSPPDALRDTCDGVHHGASRAFPDELGKPSYGCHMLDSIHQAYGAVVKTSVALVPPNPNELDSTFRTLRSLASSGTRSISQPSEGLRRFRVGGTT